MCGSWHPVLVEWALSLLDHIWVGAEHTLPGVRDALFLINSDAHFRRKYHENVWRLPSAISQSNLSSNRYRPASAGPPCDNVTSTIGDLPHNYRRQPSRNCKALLTNGGRTRRLSRSSSAMPTRRNSLERRCSLPARLYGRTHPKCGRQPHSLLAVG